MSFQGTGQSDLEVRVLHLERLLSGPQQANAEARLAAVEESLWKQSAGAGGNNPGFWAYLAPGQSVSAASGLTLGTGTLTYCTQSGGTLTTTADTFTVKNAGGAVAGGSVGYAAKVGVMADGSYSLDVVLCAAAV